MKIVLPMDADAAKVFAGIDMLIIGGDGGVAVVPKRRDDEVLERLADIAGEIRAANALSESGGSAERMMVMQLERIAAALNDGAARPWGNRSRQPDGLLTKRAAATFVGVSERGFERHVQRDLTPTRVGRRIFFAVEELEQWLVDHRDGRSTSTNARTSTSSASRSEASASFAARASEILAELRSPPRGSTRTASECSSAVTTAGRSTSPRRRRQR